MGGQLSQVLEAREPLRECGEVTRVRVPLETGRNRQHLSDTYRLVEFIETRQK